MKDNVLKANPLDNVVVAIRDIEQGEQVILDGKQLCKAAENIKMGYKIALNTITAGMPVIRYGETIIKASCDIQPGMSVHLHNTSAELDPAH
ncbi:MAG: UxaA family hydrolase [Dehalococcoidia bacterium]|nr:UxaA family hydrolase [Dehalococcoidia bacterium]